MRLSAKELEQMKSVDIGAVAPESLPDVSGIPSPTTYRKNKGLPYSCSVSDNPMWGDRVLKNILTNPIYIGDLVQGRRRVKSYKVHEIEAVPEEEWVRVADTHEAIIDRETFDKV